MEITKKQESKHARSLIEASLDPLVTINTDGKLLFLNIDDVLFVESDGNYSTIVTTERQKILITKKLKEDYSSY
jgi:DNA-binding LytR/AlgR family response regulator